MTSKLFFVHRSAFIISFAIIASMEVKVYGADWCADTQHTLKHLREFGVPCKYIDSVQYETARSCVKEHTEGAEPKPMLYLAGHFLTTPAYRELESALR